MVRDLLADEITFSQQAMELGLPVVESEIIGIGSTYLSEGEISDRLRSAVHPRLVTRLTQLSEMDNRLSSNKERCRVDELRQLGLALIGIIDG